MRIPIPAFTFEQLANRAQPSNAKVPEAVPWWLYDTQTYTDNSTTELTFFAQTAATRDLSNLQAGGSLPEPQFLAVYAVHVDFLNNASGTPYVTTAAGGVAGAIDDIGMLLHTGRGRYQLNISNKAYGPFPLSSTRGLGAALGFGWGTFTAEESLQYGYNALGDGAWYGGAIIIPPKVGFDLVMNWPAAVNLTGDYRIRATLAGVLYRRVS